MRGDDVARSPVQFGLGFFVENSENRMKTAEKSYLTVEEVAGLFGFSASAVYRLARRGILPGFKMGGSWRFSRQILEAWVADKTQIARLAEEAPALIKGGKSHV